MRWGIILKAGLSTLMVTGVGGTAMSVLQAAAQEGNAVACQNAEGGVLDCLIRVIAEIERAIVPAGAIVAFASECPAGWSPFVPAAGRFLVGAGDGDEVFGYWIATLADGRQERQALTRHQLLAVGGEEMHRLVEAEIPTHFHYVYRHAGVPLDPNAIVGIPADDVAAERARPAPVDPGNPGNGGVLGAGEGNSYLVRGNETGVYGGGQAHNTLPPYLAVNFCQRD